MDNELNRILKGTSRAFYLSLAVLPPGARVPLSLGYLLARAADTVADAPATEQFDRRSALVALRASMLEDRLEGWQAPGELKPEVDKEQELLRAVPKLGAAVRGRSEAERQAILQVVSTLIEGMIWDQDRFDALKDGRGLKSEDLETYTYLVAGCVGPFWSRVCALSDPKLSRLSDPSVDPIAIEFGKGLQWVNILRDIPKDQENLRHYLPSLERSDFEGSFLACSARALQALGTATAYPGLFPLSAIGHRLAVFLPLVLGFRTMELLLRDGGPRPERKVKVARWEVLLWLGLGPLAVASNLGMTRLLKVLRRRAEQARRCLETRYENHTS